MCEEGSKAGKRAVVLHQVKRRSGSGSENKSKQPMFILSSPLEWKEVVITGNTQRRLTLHACFGFNFFIHFSCPQKAWALSWLLAVNLSPMFFQWVQQTRRLPHTSNAIQYSLKISQCPQHWLQVPTSYVRRFKMQTNGWSWSEGTSFQLEDK